MQATKRSVVPCVDSPFVNTFSSWILPPRFVGQLVIREVVGRINFLAALQSPEGEGKKALPPVFSVASKETSKISRLRHSPENLAFLSQLEHSLSLVLSQVRVESAAGRFLVMWNKFLPTGRAVMENSSLLLMFAFRNFADANAEGMSGFLFSSNVV